MLAAILGLVACGGEQTLKQKKEVLESKKIQLAKLQNEVNMLQDELTEADSSFGEKEDLGIMVTIKEMFPERFEHFFEVNGTIQAVEMASVSPEQGGQIKEITVEEGDRVSVGNALARLNTDILQKNLDELDNGIELAQTVFDRQSRLWNKKIGSEMQYLKAKNDLESLQKKRATLLAQMEMSIIRAPFSGVVDLLHQKEGELAAPGRPILTLVNMSAMKVKADVSENYVSAVKENAEVDVDFPAFGYSTRASIRSVGNIINPANRAFSVEVNVSNKNNLLKPNGIATLRIRDFEAENVLVVPAICIGKDGKGDFLFTIEEKDGKEIAVKTYVSTGRSGNGNTMVSDGLMAGDRVIIAGYNEVANGDVVKVES